MRVPVSLSEGFGLQFEQLLSEFCHQQELLPEPHSLKSPRFLARSILPHVEKLSSMFNRIENDGDGLAPYWKETSNPAHLRLAYFVSFMPPNLYRTSSVIAELSRLGYKWSAQGDLRGIEFGAGPAAGATGIAAGEFFAPIGIPKTGNWALIEQDKAVLELGAAWAETYFKDRGFTDWEIRKFHRKLSLKQGFLPSSAPQFNLWSMSFFLNELTETPEEIAEKLVQTWDKHLAEEGLVIIVEPALRTQSRKLLAVRKALLKLRDNGKAPWLKLLLPCLGHQVCGALAAEDDWCHEDVMWWRPPYLRQIDAMAKLDRKSLPFSYMVIVRSDREIEEILPALAGGGQRERLVSPAYYQGSEQEFYMCGQSGKRRSRYRFLARSRENPKLAPAEELGRGDILCGVEMRGDVQSTRIDRIIEVV